MSKIIIPPNINKNIISYCFKHSLIYKQITTMLLSTEGSHSNKNYKELNINHLKCILCTAQFELNKP